MSIESTTDNTSAGSAAFYYDPDFRSRIHPKDINKPFCCRCQRNLDTSKAIAVTINEETWMALIGHGRAEELRTNSHPQCRNLVSDGWIGKDCLRALNETSSVEGAGMFIATVETRHFRFMAMGETYAKAKEALMRGWKEHCRQIPSADPEHICEDDISVTQLQPGDCARDGSVISNRKD